MHRSISVFLFSLLMIAVPVALPAQDFTRLTAGNAIAADGGSSVGSYIGASWIDYNGDGRLDLYVNRIGLYRNDGAGAFTKFTLPFSSQGNTFGNSWADLDNDGDLDCFVSAGDPSGSVLYRNDGTDTLSVVTAGDIGASLTNKGWGTAWADYDNDGYVDLVIAAAFGFAGITTPNRLFHNNGDGTFTRIDTGVVSTGTAPYTIPTWSDFDQDGDMDLFMGAGPANGTTRPDYLYRNMLKETGTAFFSRITAGSVATDARDGQIFNWIDYDNDGDLDVYITNYGGGGSPGLKNDLYRNDGGAFTKITVGAIVTDVAHSLASVWQDFDNDGDLDCLVTNDGSAQNRYYTNNNDGTFTAVTTGQLVTISGPHFGASAADYDGDGDVDLFVTGVGLAANNTKGLFRNDLAPGNSWLHIRCTGTVSNRSAIGTKIRALAVINGASVWQLREIAAQNSFNGQNALTAYFGFGDAAQVDSLRIEWASGLVERFANLPVNRLLHAVEGDSAPLVPLAPGDGDLNQLPDLRFRWERGRYGPPYRLQVSADSTFAAGFILDDSLVADTAADMAVVSNNSTYFWRVRPAESIHPGRWSPVRRVRNEIVPPTLLFPPEGGRFPWSVALRWSRLGGATAYDVEVAADSGFAALTVQALDLPDSGLRVDSLVPHGIYFWRVRAKSPTVAGNWSAARRFVADTVAVSVELAPRWNLVSVPLSVPNYALDSLYPGTVSGAYAYDADSGYSHHDKLENLRGYWIKTGAPGPVTFLGGSTDISLPVQRGWNLIGVPDGPVATADLATDPAGIIVTPPFGYASGYAAAETLLPGRGYWLKASAPGELRFAPTAAMIKQKGASRPSTDGLSELRVCDAGGNEQTLYLGGSGDATMVDWWELPPLPPAGIFDARFSGGTALAIPGGESMRDVPLEISASYPLTLTWSVRRDLEAALLVDGHRTAMRGEGSVTLRRPPSEILLRLAPSKRSEGVSGAFSLRQNYPNPFNPSTSIRFTVPDGGGRVRLSVYDLLGREIAVLVDGITAPGEHAAQWTPTDLPAGVYYCRLSGEGFSLTNKMMILK